MKPEKKSLDKFESRFHQNLNINVKYHLKGKFIKIQASEKT